MTHADDARMEIQALLGNLLNAAGDGSAAQNEAEAGIAYLKASKDKLQGARVHAYQELETLKEVIASLNVMFEGSINPHLDEAITHFNQARTQVEDFANKIQFQIDQIDKLIAVIQFTRIDREIKASGALFQLGALALGQYRNTL